MASIPEQGAGDPAALERALASVDRATAGVRFPAGPRRLARARAEVLHTASGAGPEAIPIAQLGYASELLLLIAVDLAAEPTQTGRIIDRLDHQAGLPRLALGREVVASVRLHGLPAGVSIEVRLAFLLAFTGATSVTLWTLAGQEPALVARAGRDGEDAAAIAETADALLGGGSTPGGGKPGGSTQGGGKSGGGDRVTGLRLERLRPPPAVLVLAGSTSSPAENDLLMSAAAPALSALLDRRALAVPEGPSHDHVLGSVERRLARLRFDLHDGPQQDVHLLAQDLGLFREQLRPMISGDPNAARLLGRLDDLEAQLVALDGDLRRLSTAVQSPLLVPGSLAEAVRAVTDAFAARTAVVPEVGFSGPLDELSDSQQIALLSLIREALSNIRKHSDAEHVQITVSGGADGVRVEIRDDGKGFDPEETLVGAARAGRLGLVGMHERVRMLGGQTQIESRPGAGTVISATLPPWPGDDEPPPLDA